MVVGMEGVGRWAQGAVISAVVYAMVVTKRLEWWAGRGMR